MSSTSTIQPLTSVALGTTATVAEIKLPPESRPRLMEMGLLVRGGSIPHRVVGHFRQLIRSGHLIPT